MGLRSGLTVVALTLTFAGVGAAGAEAAFVRVCDGAVAHATDTSTASDVLTRKVGCDDARRFIRRYDGPAAGERWRCSEIETTSFADIHCTRPGGRVIHWHSIWRRQQLTAVASSSPVRECGNFDLQRWTYRDIRGAGITNLTTRGVSCRRARRFALSRYRGRPDDTTWRCREISEYEAHDVRCTRRGGRVIHWQSGS